MDNLWNKCKRNVSRRSLYRRYFLVVRVCFDPRRSTLLYAVLAQGVVFWYVVEAWQRRVPGVKELAEDETKFGDWAHKFVAAHSMVHLTGWLIVPTMWIEARRIARLDGLCKDLMSDFGHVLANTARPRRVLAWIAVPVVLVPLFETGWMAFVEYSFAGAADAPVHVYINGLLVFGVAIPTLCCLRVAKFANNLAQALRWELVRGQVTPQRAVAYRDAWMRLSNLNGRLVATPISLSFVVAMIVFLVTLHLYESLEKLTSNQAQSGITEACLGLPYLLLLFLLCDIPHRSTEAVRQRFLDVLQMPHTHLVDPLTHEQLHQFLEIVWWNTSSTGIGNYFELKRASFNAIIAVAFTYSMVMLQFHLSINSPCRPMGNVTNPV
ncbi:gustatory and odorant receptor 63a-like [Thrips palmi]|uniref:Gustatory and odorant receptor 63a-like n=1 Tax=Thrips palmi TaxID=161013 RepID=A0A6P8YF10_THRPL|nr:gustatory and odorant receptor 63a-like [Thrips palmi]